MTAVLQAERLLEELRRAELEQCRSGFAPGMRVLDFGGGSGFQARIMASWGCDVSSIDVAGRPPEPQRHFEVTDYDGHTIPFADETFDVVFSSNVLEHVTDLRGILAELKRVMKPDGRAIHVLPSPAWRFWTIATHYPFLAKVLLGRQSLPASVAAGGGSQRRLPLATALRRGLYPNAHGAYPGALAELYFFSARRWENVFRRNGYDVASRRENGLFCTGHTLLPRMSLATRRRLARLGSSCNIYTLRAASATA